MCSVRRELGLQLVELVLELLDRPIDGRQVIRAAGLAPDVVAVALQRDLATLLVVDPRVAFLEEVHLRPVHLQELPTKSRELLDDQIPVTFGDLGVASAHVDLHVDLLFPLGDPPEHGGWREECRWSTRL